MESLKEYRCNCGKLLFKGRVLVSMLEIKCKRCGETRVFQADLPQNVFLCRDGSHLPSSTSFTRDQDNGHFSGYHFFSPKANQPLAENINSKKGKSSKNIKGSP